MFEPRVFEPLKAIALNDHGVNYVVVGGWGSLHHGATRLTQDINICPEPTSENLDRLGQALTDLGAGLHIGAEQVIPVPIIDQRLLAQMQIGNWTTDAGRLDIMHRIPADDGHDLDYAHLRRHAVVVTDQGRTFAVTSLADIPPPSAPPGERRISKHSPNSTVSSPRTRHHPTTTASTHDNHDCEIVAAAITPDVAKQASASAA